MIAALAEGYVEVYHDGELVLWYDRFRWRERPFDKLKVRLRKYLESFGVMNNDARDVVGKFVSAVAMLMDRKESTIVVFICDGEVPTAKNCRREPMRPEVNLGPEKPGRFRLNFVTTDMQKLSTDYIATILRIDGAHFVVKSEFTEIAMHIAPKKVARRAGQGTGRRAAEQLAESICSPGFVVKVSASGELRIYQGAERISS